MGYGSCQLAPRRDKPSGSENTGKHASQQIPQACPVDLYVLWLPKRPAGLK